MRDNETEPTVVDNLDAAFDTLRKSAEPTSVDDSSEQEEETIAPTLTKANESEEIVQWIDADDLLKETFANYDANTARIEKALGGLTESNVLLIKALKVLDNRLCATEQKLAHVASQPASQDPPARTESEALAKSVIEPQPVGKEPPAPNVQGIPPAAKTAEAQSLTMRAGSLIKKAFRSESDSVVKASLGRDVQLLESASVQFGDNLEPLIQKLSSQGREIVQELLESQS